MIKGHGGNIQEMAARLGCTPSEIVDMSSNVNPLGPPPGLIDYLKQQMSTIKVLPEADAGGVIMAFAKRYAIDPETILAGNGTTQFIYAIPRVLESRKALILGPTYSDYADACKMHQVPFDFAMAQESNSFHYDISQVEKQFHRFDTVFICNPNNPTGVLISKEALKNVCLKYPRTYFVVDESYLPFVPDGDSQSLVKENLENLLVLNSMSKIFRIPGLRIGFVIAHQSTIRKFLNYYLPWSVNILAQSAVIYLMYQRELTDEFIRHSQEYLSRQRHAFMKAMEKCSGIRFYDSTTSFVMAKLIYPLNSGKVFDLMARQHILIRNCNNFAGLPDHFIRISLKTKEINQMAAEKLLEIIQTAGKDNP